MIVESDKHIFQEIKEHFNALKVNVTIPLALNAIGYKNEA
jgi:hypothetical protein